MTAERENLISAATAAKGTISAAVTGVEQEAKAAKAAIHASADGVAAERENFVSAADEAKGAISDARDDVKREAKAAKEAISDARDSAGKGGEEGGGPGTSNDAGRD